MNLERHEALRILGDVAAPNLASLPQSKLADDIELLEVQFAIQFKQIPRSPLAVRVAKLFGFDSALNALKVARAECREMALAICKDWADKKAHQAQAFDYQEFLRIGGDLRQFHDFLAEHFKQELEFGREKKHDLFTIAKGLMLEQKQRIQKGG